LNAAGLPETAAQPPPRDLRRAIITVKIPKLSA